MMRRTVVAIVLGFSSVAQARQPVPKGYAFSFEPAVPIQDAIFTNGVPDPNDVTPGVTVVPLHVGDVGTMVSVDRVCLDISHTFINDLSVYLYSPGGVSNVRLIDGPNVNSGDDLAGRYCFETGATPFTFNPSGTVIVPGTYGPNDPRGFADFAGDEKFGDWNLVLVDRFPADAGELRGVSIDMTNVPEPGTIGLAAGGAMLLMLRRRR